MRYFIIYSILLINNLFCAELPKNGLGVHSPLVSGCYFDMKDLIVQQVKAGADVNAGNGLPLYYLIENGNLKMARYLIKHGADFQTNQHSFFIAAINSQKTKSIDFLLDLGLDITDGHYVRHAYNYVEKEIQNLNDLESYQALEMLTYLLEKGANPNYWYGNKYSKAKDLSALYRAYKLPETTNFQHYYKNLVIHTLLTYGAITP